MLLNINKLHLLNLAGFAPLNTGFPGRFPFWCTWSSATCSAAKEKSQLNVQFWLWWAGFFSFSIVSQKVPRSWESAQRFVQKQSRVCVCRGEWALEPVVSHWWGIFMWNIYVKSDLEYFQTSFWDNISLYAIPVY